VPTCLSFPGDRTMAQEVGKGLRRPQSKLPLEETFSERRDLLEVAGAERIAMTVADVETKIKVSV
jgi:hypothetical protein